MARGLGGGATLVVAVAAAVVALAGAQGPHYPTTIDCSTFTPRMPSSNTCLDEGDWSAVNARELPPWFADMKFGVFIHWGVYSVLSYGNEWAWHNYECGNRQVQDFWNSSFAGYNYSDFVPLFHAELYDAEEWVRVIQGAGAQYVLPDDGFCMWDARATSPGWNAAEVGPKRDVLTELYNASLKANLSFGIYYSQGEWFDAHMVADARANFTTDTFVQQKLIPQRLDLVHRYPEAILWHTDGGWFAPDSYWGNLDWLQYLYSKSPLAAHVVSCNSLGVGCCRKISGHCFEYGDAPSGGDRTTAGQVIAHFYTNQMTIQKSSWSYDRAENGLSSFFTSAELVRELISTTAWNGTLIVNMGPLADGQIPPIFQQRFADMGAWMAVNSEAIYGTRPWASSLPSGGEPHGAPVANMTAFFTKKATTGTVYALLTPTPTSPLIHLEVPAAGPDTKCTVLTPGGEEPVGCKAGENGGLDVTLTLNAIVSLSTVQCLGCGYTFALRGLTNQ